jgi:glycosyltransferase involved in cell wall biosynthesis
MSETNSVARPRVLHCITHLALGGAEEVAFSLMRNLSDEFEFAVFTSRAGVRDDVGRAMHDELLSRGVRHYTGTGFELKLGGLLFAGTRLRAAIDDFRPDIVHLHTEIPEATYAAMTLFSAPRVTPQVVRTIHNSIYWHHWRRLGQWSDRRMPQSVIAAVSTEALAAWQALRRESMAGNFTKAPALIPNGVSLNERSAIPKVSPADTLRVLFAGRFEPQKGADLLPEIVASVKLPPGKIVELSLLGQGSLHHRLATWAASPPDGWRVQLFHPRANLREHLGEYDLLLMPSRFEGLSVLAIEAQLAGVPVIATHASGLSEAFPATHPWLASVGDASDFARQLNAALRAPERWTEVAHRSREHARQHFSAKAMSARYAQLYSNALSRVPAHDAKEPSPVP